MTIAKPHGAVLVAGSANVDFLVRAPHIPAPGETVLGGDLTVLPGGKGANQAVACARAGGAATAMLVALGDDLFAPLIEQSLQGAGIALHIVRSPRPTGAALICVSDDAENAITVAPGANMALVPDDLPGLAGVDSLVLQLETPLSTVIAFAKTARAEGVRVILNAAPARALPAELLGAVDILIANQEELAMITGRGGTIADQLKSVGVPYVVATLGAHGCCAFADGAYWLQPAFQVTPVDTTAAGDTFCGVLAAALSMGAVLPDALLRASAAGALATTRLGAQSSVPVRAEVDALIASSARDETGLARLALYCGVTADHAVGQPGGALQDHDH
ncbi:ribokinase [Sphingomonas alpina]|uniref:Ribokinase n=1 Tax=Sphingomonas alpina TaxID=653931 RepID=A0A7H0LME9_9SPHN|nr:ribokinase [Sphingomonas alpina]QNQ10852.1 ribokinase [Sphingomonas alpina]